MALSVIQERRRAEQWKQKSIELTRTIGKLVTERERAFARGSMTTLGAVHAALDDEILQIWLGQRMMSARVRVPPFKLPPEIEAAVRAEIADLLKRSGIKSVRVQEIE